MNPDRLNILANRSLTEKIQFFAILFFVFLIPLNKKIIPPVILVWFIAWLVSANFKAKFSELKKSVVLPLLLLFYFLHVAGFFYSDNTSSALFDLEVKFSLLLFPVLIIGSAGFFNQYKDYFLLSFVTGNMVAATVCLLNAVFRTPTDTNFYFQYTDYSLFHHPSYAAMYALFSISILAKFLMKNPFPEIKFYKLLFSPLILILAAHLFFLSSRTNTLAAAFIIGIGLIYLLYQKKKWVLLTIALAVITVLPLVVINFHPRFIPVKRFLETPVDSLDISTGENVTIRYTVLRHSVDLIKQNYLAGTGTGDVKTDLMEMYKEKNIEAAYKQNMNAHNQYVESAIGLGLPGLAALLIMLIVPLTRSIRPPDILVLSFIFLVAINFLTESMLNTQGGVVFIAFFNTLFANRFTSP